MPSCLQGRDRSGIWPNGIDAWRKLTGCDAGALGAERLAISSSHPRPAGQKSLLMDLEEQMSRKGFIPQRFMRFLEVIRSNLRPRVIQRILPACGPDIDDSLPHSWKHSSSTRRSRVLVKRAGEMSLPCRRGILAWGMVFTLAACQEKPVEPPASLSSVGVAPVGSQDVTRSFEFVGRVKATDTVDLRARVEGFLEKRLFVEGQDVKQGDLLYQIEKSTFQALLDQAKANVAANEAILTNARLQFERTASLAKDAYAAQTTLDQRRADLDSAQAALMQTKAIERQAAINLEYTDIRAPIAGRIGRTNFTVGNLVNAASGSLATIVSQDPIYVTFPVSGRELTVIREARRQEGGSIAKIEIVVNFTDPQVDQGTDTVTMRATLPNPERVLTDGEFVTVALRERKPEPRLVVRQSGILTDQSGSYVLVVNAEDTVERRAVRTGQNVGTNAVVEDGLNDGDRVIVDGVQKVRPGQKVKATLVKPSLAAGGGDPT
jgi:membrane fusion protein, multidrug efflux system